MVLSSAVEWRNLFLKENMLEIEETITWKTKLAILDNRTHGFAVIQSNLKLVNAKTVIISIFFTDIH